MVQQKNENIPPHITVFTDFDGTLTDQAGISTVFSPFYSELFSDLEAAVMKDPASLQAEFIKYYGEYNAELGNIGKKPGLLSKEAVNFLDKALEENSNISINIISKNRKPYILAVLAYQGIAPEKLARLNIFDGDYSRDKGKAVEFVMPRLPDRSELYFFDDDLSDLVSMTDAAEKSGRDVAIIQEYKDSGQFKWDDISKKIDHGANADDYLLVNQAKKNQNLAARMVQNLNSLSQDEIQTRGFFSRLFSGKSDLTIAIERAVDQVNKLQQIPVDQRGQDFRANLEAAKMKVSGLVEIKSNLEVKGFFSHLFSNTLTQITKSAINLEQQLQNIYDETKQKYVKPELVQIEVITVDRNEVQEERAEEPSFRNARAAYYDHSTATGHSKTTELPSMDESIQGTRDMKEVLNKIQEGDKQLRKNTPEEEQGSENVPPMN